MRHLHLTGERGHPLCGTYYRETVHASHARRNDCPSCREIYRAEIRRARAKSLRQSAAQTEFSAVTQRLLAEAERLDPIFPRAVMLSRRVDVPELYSHLALYRQLIDTGRKLVLAGAQPDQIMARLSAGLNTARAGQLPGEPCRHEKTERGLVYETCSKCGAVRNLPAGEWHSCLLCAR